MADHADPSQDRRTLILYDGDCGLCVRTVSHIARRDPDAKRFTFAPIGGETYRQLIGDPPHGQPDSVLVLDEGGELVTRWSAVRLILRRLGGASTLLATLAGLVPRALGDRLYDAVARFRATHLGRRPFDSCPLPHDNRGNRFSS